MYFEHFEVVCACFCLLSFENVDLIGAPKYNFVLGPANSLGGPGVSQAVLYCLMRDSDRVVHKNIRLIVIKYQFINLYIASHAFLNLFIRLVNS